MRFHSAPVIRLADARHMQLGHALKADGRWRIVAFAPRSDSGTADGPVATLCAWLARPGGLLTRVTPEGADIDAVLDLRAVFQQSHRDLDTAILPPLLLPQKGPLALTDYEKAFCPDPTAGDIFDLRRINRQKGAILVVRPDQYVSMIVQFPDPKPIENLFKGFLKRPV